MTYLHWIQAREEATCQGCGTPNETVHHLLFECRQWRCQRSKFYGALERVGVASPVATEDHPEGRLLGEPKAMKPLLEFLSVTDVALPPGHIQRATEQAAKEEADRSGEG